MSIADELTKLSELRREGTLTDEEFERAKQKLLDEPAAAPDAQSLAVIRAQNELAQLDREWDREREKFMTEDQSGSKQVPSKSRTLAMASVFVTALVIWFMMPSLGSGFAPAAHSKLFPGVNARTTPDLSPLFGLLIVVFGVGMTIHSYVKAREYEQAHNRYQSRRQALLARHRVKRASDPES